MATNDPFAEYDRKYGGGGGAIESAVAIETEEEDPPTTPRRRGRLADFGSQAARGIEEGGIAGGIGLTKLIPDRFLPEGSRLRNEALNELGERRRAEVAEEYGEAEGAAGTAGRIVGRMAMEGTMAVASGGPIGGLARAATGAKVLQGAGRARSLARGSAGLLAGQTPQGAGRTVRAARAIGRNAAYDAPISGVMAAAGPEEAAVANLLQIGDEEGMSGVAGRLGKGIESDPYLRAATDIAFGGVAGGALEGLIGAGGRAIAKRRTGKAGDLPLMRDDLVEGEEAPAAAPAARPRGIRGSIADRIDPEGARLREEAIVERNEAQRAAETDEISGDLGVGNKRAWERARDTADADPNTEILTFDLNNFKALNDLEGHEAGDLVLRRAAEALVEASAPHGSRVFRTGGDEFVVIVPRGEADAVRQVAEEAFGELPAGPYQVSITGSAGPTFKEADGSLQAAKEARKGVGGSARGPAADRVAIPEEDPILRAAAIREAEEALAGRTVDLPGAETADDLGLMSMQDQLDLGARGGPPVEELDPNLVDIDRRLPRGRRRKVKPREFDDLGLEADLIPPAMGPAGIRALETEQLRGSRAPRPEATPDADERLAAAAAAAPEEVDPIAAAARWGERTAPEDPLARAASQAARAQPPLIETASPVGTGGAVDESGDFLNEIDQALNARPVEENAALADEALARRVAREEPAGAAPVEEIEPEPAAAMVAEAEELDEAVAAIEPGADPIARAVESQQEAAVAGRASYGAQAEADLNELVPTERIFGLLSTLRKGNEIEERLSDFDGTNRQLGALRAARTRNSRRLWTQIKEELGAEDMTDPRVERVYAGLAAMADRVDNEVASETAEVAPGLARTDDPAQAAEQAEVIAARPAETPREAAEALRLEDMQPGQRIELEGQAYERTGRGWREVANNGSSLRGRTLALEDMQTIQRETWDPGYREHRERVMGIKDPLVLVERARNAVKRATEATTDRAKRLLAREAQAVLDEVEARGLTPQLGAAEIAVLVNTVRGGMGALLGSIAGGEEGRLRGAIAGAAVALGTPAGARLLRPAVEAGIRSNSLYANPLADPDLYLAARNRAIKDYIVPAEAMSTGRFGFATETVRALPVAEQALFTDEVAASLLDPVTGEDVVWRGLGGENRPIDLEGEGMYEGEITPNTILRLPSEATAEQVERYVALRGLVTGQDAMAWSRRVPDGTEGAMPGYVLTGVDKELTPDVMREIQSIVASDPKYGPIKGSTFSEGSILLQNFDEDVPEELYRSLLGEVVSKIESVPDINVLEGSFIGGYQDGPSAYLKVVGRDPDTLRLASSLLRERVAPVYEKWVASTGGDAAVTRGRIDEAIGALEAAERGLRNPPDLAKIDRKNGRSNLDVAREIRAKNPPLTDLPWSQRLPVLLRRGMEDLRQARKEVAHGGDWYEGSMKEAFRLLPFRVPETRDANQRAIFTAILAVTSNNAKVGPNWARAIEIYQQFLKTGELSTFDVTNPNVGFMRLTNAERAKLVKKGALKPDQAMKVYAPGSKGSDKDMTIEAGLRKLDALLHNRLEDTGMSVQARKRWESMPGEPAEKFREFMLAPHTKRVKGSEIGEFEIPTGGDVIGPKVGQFMANIEGLPQYVTSDKWLKRTWDGWMGQVKTTARNRPVPGTNKKQYEPALDEDGNPILDLDDAITGPEHAEIQSLIQTLARQASEEFGEEISPAAAQGLLWYLEKQRYAALGAVESAQESYLDAAVDNLVGARPRPKKSNKPTTAVGVALAAALANPQALSATTQAAAGVAGALAPEDEEGGISALGVLGLIGGATLGGAAVRKGLPRSVANSVKGVTLSSAPGRTPKDTARQFFRRNFTNERGFTDEAAERVLINGNYAASQVHQAERALREFEQGVEKVYGGVDKMTEPEILQINRVFTGEESWDVLPPEIRLPLRKMRQHTDMLSRKLVDEGVAQGDLALTINANEGVYARRSYAIFDDKRLRDLGWQKINRPKVVNQAIAWIRREFPNLTEEQMDTKLADFLRVGEDGTNPIMALSSQVGRKDLSTFKHRKDLAPELRALWGEYGDVRTNYARSVASVASLIGNHRVLSDLQMMGNGKWLWRHDDPARPATAVPVASTGSKTMDPMNGWYATPEVAHAMTRQFGQMDNPDDLLGNLHSFLLKTNASTKVAKTALSYASQVRNFTSGILFSARQGYMTPEIASTVAGGAAGATMGDTGEERVRNMLLGAAVGGGVGGRLVRKATGMPGTGFGPALKTVIGNLRGNTPEDFAKNYQRAIELGVVGTNMVEGEMRTFLRGVEEGKITDFLQGRGQSLAGRFVGRSLDFYRAGDDVWKLFSWAAEQGRARRAFPNMDPKEIEEYAARITRNTYPNYDAVSDVVRTLQRTPIVGTFVAFPAEMIRTTYHTLAQIGREIGSDNQALKAIGYERLAGMAYASSVTAAMGAATAAMLGIDERMQQAVRDGAPPWDKFANLIYLGRDEAGNVRYINGGYTDPMTIFHEPIRIMAGGAPEEEWSEGFWTAAGTMLEPFLGEEMLFEKVVDVLRNRVGAEGSEIYRPADPWAERQTRKLAHIGTAFEPGTVSSARRVLAGATNQVSRSGKVYDLRDEAFAMAFGQRRTTYDPRTSLNFSLNRYMGMEASAKDIVQDELRSRGKVTERDVAKAYNSMDRARRKAFQLAHRQLQGAIALGVPEDDVYEILERRQGITEDGAEGLFYGEYEPWMPSENWLEGLYDQHFNPRIHESYEESDADIDRRLDALWASYDEALMREELERARRR